MSVSTTPETTTVRARAEALLTDLSAGLYERDEAIRLALLSVVAGESIFLLGPPGVGKSLIARRLKHAFRDGTSFEYLMSKFSTPDEIFGPVSIKKLREEDKYERLTDKYLPAANIVFLDEIWKAGPAIQNALLTILNEKVYRNGGEDLPVAIRGIITASNELPPNSANLAPIWDRFLLRLTIGNIRRYGNFLDMITDTSDVYADPVAPGHKLRASELDEWSERIDAIELPPEVLNTIQVVKVKMEDYLAQQGGEAAGAFLPDRRWKKIIRLLRTAAFLNGRDRVDLMDCFLMVHCLWSHPDQREPIQEIITEAVRRHGYTLAVNLRMIRQEVTEFSTEVDEEINVRHRISEAQLQPVDDRFYRLVKEDNKFGGGYIEIEQFRKLEIGTAHVCNFYDEEHNLVNRLRTEKAPEAHTILVHHNAEQQRYPLLTRQVERTELIPKPPHKLLQRHWDERCARLIEYIDTQLRKIGEESPAEMAHLDRNFFVDRDYAAVVRANLDEVAEALRGLRLQLEKTQYAYTNV